MIRQYIDKIAKNHSQAQADWIEKHLRRAIGPKMWWIIEHSPTRLARWLSHKTGVKTVVKTNPWGQRITITKNDQKVVSKDFPYKEDDSDEATA